MEPQPAQDPAPSAAADGETGEKQQYRDNGTRGGNKRKWQQNKFQHGKGGKKRDTGRAEYFRNQPDKRKRNEREQAKRRKLEEEGQEIQSVLPKGFSQEEIEAESRQPKRKVVVMIGYSGTGYKGMQIMHTEKTIEGDLFTAFVKAGAISKANANDPKKSALVRCARTDKGVHAAGNVISLKLIVEDPDIVQKINSHLSPQIRVWGIERTTGSFSAYQAVDSRWYEYLIPTYSFLPPHPNSYLGRKLVELAEECNDMEGYQSRQAEVADFWETVDREQIRPALDELEPWVRELVEKALYESETDPEAPNKKTNEAAAEDASDITQPVRVVEKKEGSEGALLADDNKKGEVIDEEMKDAADEKTEEAAIIIKVDKPTNPGAPDEIQQGEDTTRPSDDTVPTSGEGVPAGFEHLTIDQRRTIDAAIKHIKGIYLAAKQAYRVPEARLDRLRAALQAYEGTKNYHNFTVQKKFKDPSAKRLIKSFRVAEKPIIIHDTEWISLKVHGQSFMMHQIRKMVGMAALVVRCGCPISRITEAFGNVDVAIPKVPGLGLLLERPVFDSYNAKAAEKFGREKVEFTKWEKEMEEFKETEIYQRIFREENEQHQFNAFFSHLDGYREPYFLYLSSKGIAATTGAEMEKSKQKGNAGKKPQELESEDEGNANGDDG
ncbi:uncharacterized protein K452DRAFT_349917 [Aplosporella prunicola CBS 121167]|uniref:tRNA pseudouridine synthase 1 n=1 Tax=Aplosporella prunicola CBS 121167 TaxID=1176127 RepID=A0A6A6BJE8_9PEZI|nr:uncharacterized protein K452DRAFT_349917 [Aplosporella prunicola CBS 121167]KAF2144146.1 hypothetical protein K452DRAFT_349917 [Aplosporella prunicola CBS 121167]